MNKASGGDGIPVELFQILKDDAVKVLHSVCQQIWKTKQWLGRKVMTKLDSIFKSSDITLPIKVCLVKALVFPVVMYGCESWTVKKAER